MLGKVPRTPLASQQSSSEGKGRCPVELGAVPAGLGRTGLHCCPLPWKWATGVASLLGYTHTAILGDKEHHRTGTRYQVRGGRRINKHLTLLLLGSPASLLPAQEHHLPLKTQHWRIPHRCLQDNTPLAWNWNNAISRSNVISLNSYSSCTALADIIGLWTVPSPLL